MTPGPDNQCGISTRTRPVHTIQHPTPCCSSLSHPICIPTDAQGPVLLTGDEIIGKAVVEAPLELKEILDLAKELLVAGRECLKRFILVGMTSGAHRTHSSNAGDGSGTGQLSRRAQSAGEHARVHFESRDKGLGLMPAVNVRFLCKPGSGIGHSRAGPKHADYISNKRRSAGLCAGYKTHHVTGNTLQSRRRQQTNNKNSSNSQDMTDGTSANTAPAISLSQQYPVGWSTCCAQHCRLSNFPRPKVAHHHDSVL